MGMIVFDSDSSIPVSLLRQFCFCPRIPYFSLVRGIFPSNPGWVEDGIIFHDKTKYLIKRRKFERYGIMEPKFKFSVYLKSSNLGLHGICDAIIYDEERIIPCEFKSGSLKNISIGAKVQLYAYCIMASEKHKIPITKGIILSEKSDNFYVLEISKERTEKFKLLLDKFNNSIFTDQIPHSSSSEPQCSQCEYLNFCSDRM